MSFSRVVSSNTSCHSCRSALVRSFTSTTPSNGPLLVHASLRTPYLLPVARSFATSRIRLLERDGPRSFKPREYDAGFEFLEDMSKEEITTKESTPVEPTSSDTRSPVEHPTTVEKSASEALPWYLQNQSTRDAGRAEIEDRHRQSIPELPPNPPPLLQTLLEYISITAGLDDLNLLDLRHLDPPPALGPKLIMIIGTARSEKHLHVSADRFCRWLRREHNLRANAAGLLGRNELKIKLRRKMKRMKMLANVGGQEMEGNIDDGIRTGWICCTVGKIEAHPEDTEMPGADVENFVGFRDIKPGVNVVVQMFTEEKREEIDLETLWNGVLKTNDRKNTEAEDKLKALEEDFVEEEVLEENLDRAAAIPQPTRLPASRLPSDPFPTSEQPPQRWKRPTPSKGDAFPSVSRHDSVQQLRRLHTVGLHSNFVV